MIQIYEPENIEFSRNGDMVLFPTKCTVKATLNSQWILEMEHPLDTDGRWESIVDYAVIKVPSFNGEQLFRISNKTKTDTHISVTAEPIFMDARNDCFLKDVRPTGKNGQDALNIMCAQNPKYSGKSDITKACTSYYETQNLIEAINGDDANSFINRWGGEILFDNYTVMINNRVGGDYGVNILYGKNIIKDGISEEIDMDVITRIVPKSFNGYMLPGEAPWVDSPIISNYPVVHTKVIKYEDIKLRADANENDEESGVTIVDTMEELQTELVRRCNEEFIIKGVDKPKVNISVKILLLQNTETYKEYEELEHVSLGDTVHLEHSRLGIVTDARVIDLEYDCIREITSSVDIGEFTYNYFNDISSTLDRVDKVIRPDGSLMAEKVQGILDGINTQLRLQSTVAKKVNGRAFEISDLDPESELYGCMIFGSQGLQIATERTADGRDWNWRTAITAKGVVADAIITGLLSDRTGRNYWNLDTGEFRMTMEAFTVDGKTVEDIAKGIADEAQKLAQAYADKQLSDFTYVVSGDIYNLQKQIDGQIETYYYDYEPTLNNAPASKWTTETERAKHEGDLFYWKSKGYAYRFFKEGGVWKWQLVQDTDVTKALANASIAQDTADSKRRIFIAQPTTPYDVGDTWMDGRDILTCTVSRQTGACQSSDWRKLNAYTDDAALNAFISGDYKNAINALKTQADKKAETWRQADDPAAGWTQAEKAEHKGDLWYKTTDQKAYIYTGTAWELMKTAPPDEVFDKIDGKAQIFVSQPAPPYAIGDLWTNGTDILTCTVDRATGNYVASDWKKLNKYTDNSALQEFISGDYKYTIEDIQNQTDQKAETWWQPADPSTAWENKAEHKGDIWYNTTEKKSYIYTGSAWEEMKATPPDEIFDRIDGKAQIYINQPVPPYQIGDLWFNGADILTCVVDKEIGAYAAADWEKRNAYTDDSYAKQVEGIVEALGDDLHQQLDGKIESYSQSNDPSSAWTQDIQKQQHTGDIWYNTDTKTTKRWSGTVWEELANGKADAAAELAKAKCKVYINQPVPPYRICDLWVQGDIGDIMVSSVTREAGSFVASDWRKASNYSESAYYFLESNINHLEISRADGYIYPSVFTLSAFKQKNGTPPSRGAYKGKIQVYGVYNDGESTTTIYKTTSGTTESTVDIQTSGLDEYTEIRCELWSDVDKEGYIHRLQVIHIPVGRDPLTLNWEETFDMLTNNGKIQGLFAENGQIYINASFIRSGELILGGLNNQYGTFKLKDANDNDIGIWDKQGMTLTNSKGDYRIMFNTSFGTFDNVISVEKKVSGTNVPIAFMKTTGYIGTYNPTNKLGCGMAAGEVNFTYRSSASGNDAAIGYIAGSRSGTENALAIQSYGVLQLLSQKLVIVDTDPWKAYEGGSGTIKVITQDSSGKQWITTLTYLNGIMVTNLS